MSLLDMFNFSSNFLNTWIIVLITVLRSQPNDFIIFVISRSVSID